MKKTLVVGVVVAVVLLAWQRTHDDATLVTDSEPETYAAVSAPDLGLAFQYRTAPNGYVLHTLEKNEQTDPDFERLYTLMLATDYEFMQGQLDASEWPPSIGITVYKNSNHETTSTWVDAHPEFSNSQLIAGAVNRDVTVAGVHAVRYTVDGLYLVDTIVVANGEFIYVLTGAYLEFDSIIHHDFEVFAESLQFVPLNS
ncbi:hypothetical protein KC902_03145 [Candidatus Kaiserbacteria bacterium]|nr:hypothetical protein [Candidatus Kaiserbacteria bacterium]USN88441.1 MAG: hypothetical protein H6780_03020 [Candidatus Nomurabacteria bacterium]